MPHHHLTYFFNHRDLGDNGSAESGTNLYLILSQDLSGSELQSQGPKWLFAHWFGVEGGGHSYVGNTTWFV